MKKLNILVILLFICGIVPLKSYAQASGESIIALNPTLYYNFEGEDLTAPVVGTIPLEFYYQTENSTFGDPDPAGPSVVTNYTGKKAIAINKENNIKIINPSGPSDGGEKRNSYTVLYDIMHPNVSGYTAALLQTNDEESKDAILFAKNGTLGLASGGMSYSSFSMEIDKWYRVVVTVSVVKDENDLDCLQEKIFVNGTKILEKLLSDGIDNKFAIRSSFWIFTDEDFEETYQECQGFAFWDKTLSEEEVSQLGTFDLPYSGTAFTNYPENEGGAPQSIPGIVEPEYFDNGGIGMAYIVTNQSEAGENNTIRKDEKVVIREDWMGNQITIENRNWLKYTVDVKEDGLYQCIITASSVNGGRLSLLLDDKELGGATVVPSEDLDFGSIINGLELTEGRYVLQLKYTGETPCNIAELYFETYNNNTEPTLVYDFSNLDDLTAPTTGEHHLEFYKQTSSNSIGDPDPVGPEVLTGAGPGGKNALGMQNENNIKIINSTGASDGGARLNTFTMLFDLKLPDISSGYPVCFFQGKEDNNEDGGLFMKGGLVGINAGGYGYSEKSVPENEWARIIIVNNHGRSLKIYLNGELINDRNVTANLDARFSLGEYFWIFTDNDFEEKYSELSKFAFWGNVALSKLDMENLGIDGGPITGIHSPKVPATGNVYASDGSLHFKGFTGKISVNIYNLVGQQIAAYKNVENNLRTHITKGVYLVNVEDNGKTATYKVLVK
jgi:hypothetical protein